MLNVGFRGRCHYHLGFRLGTVSRHTSQLTCDFQRVREDVPDERRRNVGKTKTLGLGVQATTSNWQLIPLEWNLSRVLVCAATMYSAK